MAMTEVYRGQEGLKLPYLDSRELSTLKIIIEI